MKTSFNLIANLVLLAISALSSALLLTAFICLIASAFTSHSFVEILRSNNGQDIMSISSAVFCVIALLSFLMQIEQTNKQS